MTAPPDLRVVCRRLASTPVDDLPRLCPVLVNHVLRCGGPLSAPVDNKTKDKSDDTPMLVHKLRTHMTTLLTGKSPAGRFAAVFLVKAAVDVGGWETLRAAAPWLRGLIGVLNKPDPLASKELSIVTLTKMYILLQAYPTLVREMATPTLPDYVSACLNLIKPPASGKPVKVPAAFVDTVTCSLAKLVVLYPTTLRPFAATMRAALRAYIAPTCSDSVLVPQSLRESARRLFTLLPYTAPKNGSSDEWLKAIRSTILEAHATLDQIFRGVVESWESTTGYHSQAPQAGLEPTGGGDSPEELPPWSGLQSGAERAIGLLEFLSEYIANPTKAAVSLPLGELLDLATRITLVTPPSPGSEDSISTNPAIGRDEKAELWSVLPDLHTAVLQLHHALLRRLEHNALPLTTDMIDQMVRVYAASGQSNPSLRIAVFSLTKLLLLLCGPTLPKLTVDSLAPVIQSVCHDLLLAAGHLDSSQPTTTTINGTTQNKPKPTTSTTNADAYLPSSSTSTPSSTGNSTSNEATALLPYFFSHLPQPHLSPDLRSLLDRTAILASHRDAMLASCLRPYRDGRGRCRPSVLPFLVRAFPGDLQVEVLRSNLLRVGGGGSGGGEYVGGYGEVGMEVDDDAGEEEDGEEDGEEVDGEGEKEETGEAERPATREVGIPHIGGVNNKNKTNSNPWGVTPMDVDSSTATTTSTLPVNQNPFAAVVTTTTATTTSTATSQPPQSTTRATSPLKRKSDSSFTEADTELGEGQPNPPKRLAAEAKLVAMSLAKTDEGGDGSEGSESESEGSVMIDMGLDDDDDDDEEEEEEEGE